MRGQRSRKPIGFRLWVVHKLDDGAKKYLMGVADGMSFCNMSEDLKRKPEEKEAVQKGR